MLCAAVCAQDRPLATESAEGTPNGKLRLELGFEHQVGASYALTGLKGDLTRVGVLQLRVGASDRVEFQILGTLQDFLSIEERGPAPYRGSFDFSGDRTHDVGDFTLATKFLLKREGQSSPALGFRFGAELPNASNESGLGVDETNVFGSILASKKVGAVQLHANAGLIILGDPVTNASQDDLLTYGLALVVPVRRAVDLALEVAGRTGQGRGPTGDRSLLRGSVRIRSGSLLWDVGVLSGLTKRDPDFGFSFGISKEWTIF